MEKIHQNIQTVREIRGSVTGFIRQVRDEFRADNAKILGSQLLTYEGKQAEEKKLKEQYDMLFLGKMLEADEMINKLLDESKDEAEKVLTAALPEVSEQQQKLFNMALKNAKGKVMFAVGTNQAFVALDELVQTASEPLLAQQASEKVLKLAPSVLALATNNDKAAVKQRLGSMFQQLDGIAQVEGAQEARAALKTINGLKGSFYATGLVQDALKEISMNAYNYVNNPKAYFDKYAQA